jgi:hypothetical protein
MEQRVSLITLGVADLKRSSESYERLGMVPVIAANSARLSNGQNQADLRTNLDSAGKIPAIPL